MITNLIEVLFLTAISILAKLSSHEENEDVLSEALSEDIYSELIRCLTAPDIQVSHLKRMANQLPMHEYLFKEC